MTLELRREEGGVALMVRVSGKLSKDDYERFVPEVETLIKEHGKVRILFEMVDFHGWELGALWEDIKFDLKHFGDIKRLAMVGDKKWEEWMAKFCKPFTSAKIQYFDQSEKEQARAWLESDVTNVGNTPEEATVRSLVEDLGAQEGRKRESARGDLVAMGARAVGVLTGALDGSGKQLRWEVTKALAEIRDRSAVPGLVESLGDDESDIRWIAAEGLIALERSGLESLLQALVHDSMSTNLRRGAHHVLKELARGELQKTLQPVLAALDGQVSEDVTPVAASAALEELRR